LRVKSEIVRAGGDFLREEGFVEILPVLLSRITDPLHHETYGGAIDYYGAPYQLTKSMILHKQIALQTLPRVFCFSPNVRMEPAERASAGRYLAEFVQLDLEVRDASRDDVIAIGEGLLISVLTAVAEGCSDELKTLGRDLAIPTAPFKRISYADAAAEHGEPFDDVLSARLDAPTWVIDFPRRIREFYDREDPTRPEVLLDMDLVYPEGFGEALSGGEREFEIERILDRIDRDALSRDQYADYLTYAERGLPKTAGFGIGVERLTRYVCGLTRVEDARLFPKAPGDTRAI
jgi:asparaginyl-tRNA synthetase